MTGVLTGFAVVSAVILVGYVAGRFQIAGPHAAQALTRTAFFITNPALLFTVLAKSDLSGALSAYAPIALLLAGISAGLYVLSSRIWFKRAAAETAIGAMASSYVNANNIGIPIAVYALGSAAPVAPVLLVQLLLLAPLYLTILDTASGRKTSVRIIATQPFRNPMIIASFLGVLASVTGIKLPTPVWEPLEMLGGAAVPLVLMAFGMSLHGSRPLQVRQGRVDVIVATVLKSVVMPAIAYLLGRFLFHLQPPHVLAVVVMAALPTAQNVFLFASRYQRGVAVARDAALLTSVLAIPVLIMAAWLLA